MIRDLNYAPMIKFDYLSVKQLIISSIIILAKDKIRYDRLY